jgi:hypothetical protein
MNIYDSTLTLLMNYTISLSFICAAFFLIVAGTRAFFRGTGIQKLKDHSFEISGAGFQMNYIVSSVGGLMLAAGCVFGLMGYLSKPQYEANLLSGYRKIANSDVAVPRAGSGVMSLSGKEMTIDNVKDVYAFPNANKNVTIITKNSDVFDADVNLKMVDQFVAKVRNDPNDVVVLDFGGSADQNNFAPDEKAIAWKVAFERAGVTSDQLVIIPASLGKQQLRPTISLAKKSKKKN